jgi:hypothetical protein
LTLSRQERQPTTDRLAPSGVQRLSSIVGDLAGHLHEVSTDNRPLEEVLGPATPARELSEIDFRGAACASWRAVEDR